MKRTWQRRTLGSLEQPWLDGPPDFYGNDGAPIYNMGPPPSDEFCRQHPEVRQFVTCAPPLANGGTVLSNGGQSNGDPAAGQRRFIPFRPASSAGTVWLWVVVGFFFLGRRLF